MKAAIWTGEAIEVTETLTVRGPATGEVTVEIEAVGLCHSDLNPIEGRYDQPVPAVLGHEAVGRVVGAGRGAEHLRDTRVVLSPLVSCGICRQCRRGSPTACSAPPRPHQAPFDLDGTPVHQFVHIGAFAARTVVTADQVIPVPDDLPAPSAALLGCAVITGTGAVARADVRPGDRVLVTGAGGIGLNAIQEAAARGAEHVLVCDRDPRKAAIATTFGATEVVVTETAEDVLAAVRDRFPDGVDAAIECVGRVDILEAAIASVASGGRAVIVGLPGIGERLSADVRHLFRDRSILGCRMGSVDPRVAIPGLVERYQRGELEIDGLVSRVAPIDEIAALVEDFTAGRLDRGVLTFP